MVQGHADGDDATHDGERHYDPPPVQKAAQVVAEIDVVAVVSGHRCLRLRGLGAACAPTPAREWLTPHRAPGVPPTLARARQSYTRPLKRQSRPPPARQLSARATDEPDPADEERLNGDDTLPPRWRARMGTATTKPKPIGGRAAQHSVEHRLSSRTIDLGAPVSRTLGRRARKSRGRRLGFFYDRGRPSAASEPSEAQGDQAATSLRPLPLGSWLLPQTISVR